VTRRVLHYVDPDSFGGSEQAALHLMAALDRAQWEPVLLHHSGPASPRLRAEAAARKLRTVEVPAPGARLRPRALLRLLRAIRAERPALLHVHLSWPLAGRPGVGAARLARVPAVGTAQLYMRPDSLLTARLHLSGIRRIIAVSREVEARYTNELGVSRRKLVVIPNGMAIPATVPATDRSLRARLLEGRPDYLVLTPARLDGQKGHADLLAAAAQVPQATFVLAGEGPLRGELEELARRLGVADRCLFLGHRDDVPDLLAAADLFVLPSHFEGLPVSVLEAMSAARPVVATAVGGTDEAVTDGETGLLVPPRDPAALAAAVRRISSDPELARRLATAGRARVEREFSAEATACAVAAVYDEVLAGSGARERAAIGSHGRTAPGRRSSIGAYVASIGAS
jgi:glycosyltransferase involved in cell wall biosynthesis